MACAAATFCSPFLLGPGSAPAVEPAPEPPAPVRAAAARPAPSSSEEEQQPRSALAEGHTGSHRITLMPPPAIEVHGDLLAAPRRVPLNPRAR